VLREVLFRLWGDLEEKKSAFLNIQNERASKAAGNSTASNARTDKPNVLAAKPGDDLPPDSDDESTSGAKASRASKVVPKERDMNNNTESNPLDKNKSDTDPSTAIASLPITNKGFTCCIQQYGIKVPEKSCSKADAGRGFRWKRIFGLFGTQIV
jgi:protection of telomeres protein 1